MFQVVKRDGQMDEFKIGKITSAIDKAFNAQEKNYSKEMIDLLGLRVTADFQGKVKDDEHFMWRRFRTVWRSVLEPGRICRCGQGLYSLPQAAGKTA